MMHTDTFHGTQIYSMVHTDIQWHDTHTGTHYDTQDTHRHILW